MQRVTLIDNYDSFTFNLVHYLGELGADVSVWRNDEITVADALADKPDAIVLSPGPCTPNEAGVCLDLVRMAQPNDADARGLPWPPGDRAGVWRRCRARASADAWQGVPHFAQCARALPWSERTVLRDPLSFARHRAIKRARRARGERGERRRSHHGRFSTSTARHSGSSSIQRASPASTAGKFCAISWTSPEPFISASKHSDENAKRGYGIFQASDR